MTTASDELIIERNGSTLTLVLNRPEKRNALSDGLVSSLLIQVSEAAQNGVRLLILKGNGKNFSAGFDFSNYESESEGDLILRFIRIEQLLQAIYYAPFETLALAHGKNFGAGVDIVCACSLRIGDPSATFQMPGLSFGIVLGTRRYASRVGLSVARHVLQEGTTFDASAGTSSGFLTSSAAKGDWDHVIEQTLRSATHLTEDANARLNRATCTDTRSDDLADLVSSAATPGLKERIRSYRS